MRKPSDRTDLLLIIRQQAATDLAMHVDDFSDRWDASKARSRDYPSVAEGAHYAGVWRGLNDDEQEAGAIDLGHKGGVWLTFPKGRTPDRSLKLRQRFIAATRDSFSYSRAIPILPSSALPSLLIYAIHRRLQSRDVGCAVI